MRRESVVFLDTSYAIALCNGSDIHHVRAQSLARDLSNDRVSMVTTQAVVFEIGNSLSRLRFRSQAVELLRSLHEDATISVLPLNESLYAGALALFSDRQDKEWSLTDCASFLVMQSHGIKLALTADQHFVQAGFVAALRPGQ